jgi:hypothetical protein
MASDPKELSFALLLLRKIIPLEDAKKENLVKDTRKWKKMDNL